MSTHSFENRYNSIYWILSGCGASEVYTISTQNVIIFKNEITSVNIIKKIVKYPDVYILSFKYYLTCLHLIIIISD
jgi:hypothetical protein